jgi:ABC-type polysaccharide/polyol phosphate transport system ATPase subunit
MSEPMIKVKNLTKAYKIYAKPIDRLKEAISLTKKNYHKDFYALNDVSFEVNKGETVGIVGKNGCGKSTLLKIITGVLNESQGSVEVNGKVSALLELGAGFNPEYTGIQNIYLNGSIMGYTKEEMDKKLEDIIEFADIGDFINQPVKTYSSGMFVRLAFAAAINVEPDILIVDEALSVGDIFFKTKCISKMNQLMNKGTTILFVTHEMDTIKRLCKRCVFLQNGEVKAIGPSQEIADMYMAETRLEMNESNKKIVSLMSENTKEDKNSFATTSLAFKQDDEFQKQVKLFREGTGDARVTALEVLNENGNNLKQAKFNEDILIRIYLKFYKSTEVAVGYHIRDNKHTEIIGSGTWLEANRVIGGKQGEQYIVEFKSKIPLMDGEYNLTLVVSTPVIENRTALFVDYIENAYVFGVEERWKGKLWNKVYLKNDITIAKVASNNTVENEQR